MEITQLPHEVFLNYSDLTGLTGSETHFQKEAQVDSRNASKNYLSCKCVSDPIKPVRFVQLRKISTALGHIS